MAEIFQNREQKFQHVGKCIAAHRMRFSCIAVDMKHRTGYPGVVGGAGGAGGFSGHYLGVVSVPGQYNIYIYIYIYIYICYI